MHALYTALYTAGLAILTRWHALSCAQLLLPDGLHPNAAGMEYVAQCLEKVIAPIMEEQLAFSAGGVSLQAQPPVLSSHNLSAMP